MSSKITSVSWEFERVSRLLSTAPPFEVWTPLLRGEGNPPSSVVVNRHYVVTRREDGIVHHQWADKEHLDCEAVWGNAWETPVYDPLLHAEKKWLVWLDRQKQQVQIPEKPNGRPVSCLSCKPLDSGWEFRSTLKKGERIRQSVGPNGAYVETRVEFEKPTVFHVKPLPSEWTYDAILVTCEGFEEKIILRGELV